MLKILNSQSIFEQKDNFGGITIPDLKPHSRAIVTKIAWYWHKSRFIDQSNREEIAEITLCTHSQLIFGKGAKNMPWRKESFSINGVETSEYLYAEDELRTTPHPTGTYFYSLRKKWIQNALKL